jgi:hypothetical protein
VPNIYAWVRNNIFNPTNGQIYEGISSNGAVIVSDNVYNSGAFINAANCLHNLTGATNYYVDALLAVNHVINNNAILSNTGRGDSTWEDQFARGLANFAQDNQLWGLYNSWMTANANAAWNSRRIDRNITWNSWTSPTATNDCYSLECLSAAVIQQVIPTITRAAPVFTLQPSNQISAVGNAIGLNAIATNGQPITYQWYHENNPIPGAIGTNLVLLSLSNSDAGHYWVVASNAVAGAYSQVANIYLIGSTNGTLAQDAASNYDRGVGFIGNQGFGFGPWIFSTPGGGGYLSDDVPPLFGLWNSSANGQSIASRVFNLPLPVGGSFTLQLEMNTLDTAANQNGFGLQDAGGNTLFSYWHQGGDNANGHYADANGTGSALGFAYDFGQPDNFKFTLTTATDYTFSDLTTGRSFNGKLSGAAINEINFFRINGANAPSNGQDFKFSNLAITVPPHPPTPAPLTVGETVQGWSFRFPVAPGYSYRLQRATNLEGPWADLGTLIGPESGMAEFIDTNSPTANSFYRTVTP